MGVEVTVLRPHVWRGEPYEVGATYLVEGDGSQSEREYLRTLKAFGLAEPQSDVSQPVVKVSRKKAGAA
jgi:hypothetical protein